MQEVLSPFNVTNVSSETAEGAGNTCSIDDILVKESPCTRVAAVTISNNGPLGVPGAGGPIMSKSNRPGKKISNECLQRVEADTAHYDDEGSDGVLKDEEDMFEYEDLPIINRSNNNKR